MINFTIQHGESIDQIGETLKQKKLIRSSIAFKIQVALSGLSRSIQAGEYRLSTALSLKQIINSLTQGTSDRWVTLIEGWRREQIAQEIVNEFNPKNPNYSFDPKEFVQISQPYEGQLYPDTYAFPLKITSQEVLNQLLKNFKKRTQNLVNQTSLTNDQALILASLIEREAASDQERPIISGILYKRLRNGWPLQVDATVQYLKASRDCQIFTCDWWPNSLSRSDFKSSSPFNTYAQPGLPPHPIANPSLASIKAALNPVETSYWFYLHDSQGRIHYAETRKEHNQHIKQYLNQ